jgi:thiol:disulfide interchange protein DsbD
MEAARHIRRIAAVSLAIVLLPARAAMAGPEPVSLPETAHNDRVGAQLVANVLCVAPSRTFLLGVRFHMADTWHINWINPGDAGLAPSIAWTLPEGFEAGPVEWPAPRRYVVGPLAIFGYDHEVLLVARIAVPDHIDAETIELRASVDWLACREACVPGDTSLVLSLPVETSPRPDLSHADLFADAERRVPTPAENWSLAAFYRNDQIVIDMQPVLPEVYLPAGVEFFPTEQGIIENAESQELRPAGRGFQLLVTRSRAVGNLPARLTGVLVAGNGWSRDGSPQALQVDVTLEPR